jgi:multiple sugar transport system permease protein
VPDYTDDSHQQVLETGMQSDFKRSGVWFLVPLIIFLAATTLAPILYVLVVSFTDYYLPASSIKFSGFTNYEKYLIDGDYWKSAGNTGVYVFFSTVCHIVVATVLAVFLDKPKGLFTGVGRRARNVLIVPWLFSWAVAAALWRLILSPGGILNAYLIQWGIICEQIPWFGTPGAAMAWIIAITIWKAFPFFMMMVYAGLMTIPGELYESAQIDGAGTVARFFGITLPSLAPTLLTLIVLDVIWSLRQYDIIFLTTAGGPLNTTRTLTLEVYYSAFEKLRFGLASAQGVFILILSSILAGIYIRIYEKREL